MVLVAAGSVLIALAGILVSNGLYDRGVSNTLSRYFAPVLGGMAFLVAVLWLDAWTATVLAGVMAVLVLALKLRFRQGLRGIEGYRPSQAWGEVTYVVAGTLSLAVGWVLLGDRWLAFLPIAFMAWGDAAAGILRASMWRDEASSRWPSIAMLGVCLCAATLYQPYWIGSLGALLATLAERYRPRVSSLWDDNMNIVTVSLGCWQPAKVGHFETREIRCRLEVW